MEPLPEDAPEKFVFEKEIVGNAIPPSFIPACEKGFREACNSGGLTGHPVQVAAPHPPSVPWPACITWHASLAPLECAVQGCGGAIPAP